MHLMQGVSSNDYHRVMSKHMMGSVTAYSGESQGGALLGLYGQWTTACCVIPGSTQGS